MSQRVWGLGLFAALIALASIAACRQLVGITDNPPEDLVTSICGLPYGTNTCASCVSTSCCTESTTCAADPGCAAYQSCLGQCSGDPGCRSRCIGDNPVGTSSDVSALSACLASNCETACGLTCGSIGASVAPPDAGASCETCLESKGASCDPARACGSSVDCQAYAQCLHAYTTPDWFQACATEHDAGAALYALLDNVASAGCAAACAYGLDWRCVGHVTWPTPAGPPGSATTFVFDRVHDGNTSAAIAGAKVAFCTASNVSGSLGVGAPQCDPPFVSGVTNDAGYVEINVPTAEPNSGTLVGSDWWALVSAPGYPPFYYYSFFPLSQSVWTASPGLSPYVFTASDLAAAYAAALDGGAQTPGTGGVQAWVYDCQYHAAPGVQVTASPAVLSSDAGTVASGFGMGSASFGNVPVGTLTLTATPPGLGKAIGQFSFYVTESAETVVGLYPQP